MSEGDQKTATIPAEEAYGPRRDDLVLSVPREQLPTGMEPEIGQQLRMQTAQGQSFVVQVVEVGGDDLQVDANHPLAGRDLTFEIELVGIT
jgi:peptidylprolyl isomerase